jgi:hypothetical protein
MAIRALAAQIEALENAMREIALEVQKLSAEAPRSASPGRT